MNKKPEHELNDLFTLYDEIRKAEIVDNKSLVKMKLSEALTESCLFLTKLVHDLVPKLTIGHIP